MRNMSFMLTQEQIRDKTKDVTRRLGWWFLKGGELVMACEKCQGLELGEKIIRIRPIRIVSSRGERLDAMRKDDVAREGFLGGTEFFISMFCAEMKCKPRTLVNRIEFEYLTAFEERMIMAEYSDAH